MADDEEIPVAEITAKFLSQAPPLQFPSVLEDVKTIIDDAAIIDAVAPKSRKLYNHNQMACVASDDGKKVLTTDYNEVADNEYLDSASGQVFTIDHMEKKITGERAASEAELGGNADLRAAVGKLAQSYAEENFDAHVYSGVFSQGDGMVLCIATSNYDAKNMWSGRWKSAWSCTFADDEVVMKGNFSVHVHFYEDGNVQSKSDHTTETSVCKEEDVEHTAKAMLEEIKKEESEYQALLDGTFVNFQKANSIMNGLRRPLPIDKKPVDFRNLITQGRLAGQLR